jgi:hypothetical protein
LYLGGLANPRKRLDKYRGQVEHMVAACVRTESGTSGLATLPPIQDRTRLVADAFAGRGFDAAISTASPCCTNRPYTLPQRGRIVVNTGSFLKYMSAQAAIIEGERLEVRLVNQRDGNFTLGKVKEVFTIPGAAAESTFHPLVGTS